MDSTIAEVVCEQRFLSLSCGRTREISKCFVIYFFSGYIFLGRCLRCFETIPGPVHGGGVQAKFPSGDLGFSASLSPLLLLGVWLDPES